MDRKRTLEPVEFARWVEERDSRLADRWLSEVRARQAPLGKGVEGLLSRFFSLLASMLPVTLGPYRDQLDPIWQQAAELYGSVTAQRGLAVGEAVDEFQILREMLIRELYTDPPGGGRIPIPLRDLLRVNRTIDRGVTQASVGHADVLFFALFQGSGVPEQLSAEVTREVGAQLDSIRDEFRSLVGSVRS